MALKENFHRLHDKAWVLLAVAPVKVRVRERAKGEWVERELRVVDMPPEEDFAEARQLVWVRQQRTKDAGLRKVETRLFLTSIASGQLSPERMLTLPGAQLAALAGLQPAGPDAHAPADSRQAAPKLRTHHGGALPGPVGPGRAARESGHTCLSARQQFPLRPPLPLLPWLFGLCSVVLAFHGAPLSSAVRRDAPSFPENIWT